jgi:hypothetical protein
MAFSIKGISPIQKVLCRCGAELTGRLDKCPKCGKEIIDPNLRTSPEDTSEKSQVK